MDWKRRYKMANHKILAPFILSHEGGFSNDKNDHGGATMKGVTLATFRSVYGQGKTVNDLKKITTEQWNNIFKKYYWDKCNADLIDNQSIANMLVDFAWHSGVSKATEVIQKIVGVTADGIIGRVTIGAINGFNRGDKVLFDLLKQVRMVYLRSRKNWKYFKNGWTTRVESIKYGSLTYSGKTIKC